MPWYAASAIMYFKFKDGKQDSYPIEENVLLIEADTPEVAEKKAWQRAQKDEGDNHNSLTYGDRPATLVFAGFRKILTVAHPDSEGKELNEAEVTFSDFVVKNYKSFRKYVNGEDVTMVYCAD